ncbi:MAG: hypothetical protein IKC83_05395 [Clostridia bacterium]|nr:hypothetical protein [Clostridia bacterium]
MSKKNKLLFAYLGVMISLTFVRICFNESWFGELDSTSSDRLFSTIVQIVCMGIIPLCAIILTDKKKKFGSVAKRIGYRPFQKRKNGLARTCSFTVARCNQRRSVYRVECYGQGYGIQECCCRRGLLSRFWCFFAWNVFLLRASCDF